MKIAVCDDEQAQRTLLEKYIAEWGQTAGVHVHIESFSGSEQFLFHWEEDLTTIDTVLKTGNVMVDAILNSKLTMIKERNIRVDATAMVPDDISISGVDLSVLIGNLLDNAMEVMLPLVNHKS